MTANGAGPRLEIEWREVCGRAIGAPARKGFGTRLIERGIRQELKGAAEIAYDRTGLRCRIEIPVASTGT